MGLKSTLPLNRPELHSLDSVNEESRDSSQTADDGTCKARDTSADQLGPLLSSAPAVRKPSGIRCDVGHDLAARGFMLPLPIAQDGTDRAFFAQAPSQSALERHPSAGGGDLLRAGQTRRGTPQGVTAAGRCHRGGSASTCLRACCAIRSPVPSIHPTAAISRSPNVDILKRPRSCSPILC